MKRVNKTNPCPICNKPDWCLISDDAAICARVSEGSKKRCGDAGWLHYLRPDEQQKAKFVIRDIPQKGPKPDFEKLVKDFQKRLSTRQLRWLASSLDVSVKSLQRLGVGWDGSAFSFPMFDEKRNIIGIRRRYGSGQKFAIKGSSNGLFIPEGLTGRGALIICEGPTDCAAGLDFGFDAIGRPNCDSRIEMTARFARGRKVTIIADNDLPGVEGAKKLSRRLIACCPDVKIIVPPIGIKDLRQWKSKGLTWRAGQK